MTTHRASTTSASLVTNDAADRGDGPLGIAHRRARRVRRRRRSSASAPARAPAADQRIDAGGRCVMPGFVDSHTHLVFAGDRGDEFAARMAGRPYEAGGHQRDGRRHPGARPTTTLRSLAAAPARRGAPRRHHDDRDQVGLRAHRRSTRRRCLRIAGELTGETTFLGAHVVPPEFAGRADDYVELVCGEMLAACRAARPLDRRVLRDAARSTPISAAPCSTPAAAAGLGLRLHANQLGPGPGVAARRRDGLRVGRPLHVPHRRRRRGARRRHRPWRRSCRRPTSRPASRTPTPGA